MPSLKSSAARADGKSGDDRSGDAWTVRDIGTLLSGIGGVIGTFVAVFAVVSNGNSTRRTTLQKANEAEIAALDGKLEKFYGPYLQLSATNRLIATELKSRHADPAGMRLLLLLLSPDWRAKLSPGDAALFDEIVAIDKDLLELINKVSGLTSSAVQPYLGRAAAISG